MHNVNTIPFKKFPLATKLAVESFANLKLSHRCILKLNLLLQKYHEEFCIDETDELIYSVQQFCIKEYNLTGQDLEGAIEDPSGFDIVDVRAEKLLCA